MWLTFEKPRSDAAASGGRDELRHEVEAAADEEARRGARFVLPFLLPALLAVRFALGSAFERPAVRAWMGIALAVACARWLVLAVASRSRGRGLRLLSTLSAWAVSVTFGGIYLAAAGAVDAVQVMSLAVVASAVCGIAMLSISADLGAYLGYVAIHLGAIVVLMAQLPRGQIMGFLPLGTVAYAATLSVMALRMNRVLREKILLGLRLRDSALRDALTGLRNRRFVNEYASQLSLAVLDEWTAAGSRRRPGQRRSLAVFLVDLDHFKHINDAFGHSVGDEVLVGFARVAQSAVRMPDVVSRWGGEEFLVLAEVTDRESVATIGERIRSRVEAHRLQVPGGRTIGATCSLGACLFPFDEARPAELSWEETVALADSALYEAKRKGRNQTCWLSAGSTSVGPKQILAAVRAGLDGAVRAGAVEMQRNLSSAGARSD